MAARAQPDARRAGKITPMMRQYFEAKDAYADAIVLFHLGDFYEMFFEDAKLASELLELTLTKRGTHEGEPIPMAGVPVAAVNNYVRKLVEAGHRVALCEQVEDASLARGLVRREVVRVLSPGVRLDAEALDADRPNYLVGLARARSTPEGPERLGLAALDVSTGDLRGTTIDGPQGGGLAALLDELGRLDPAEIITDPADASLAGELRASRPDWVVGSAREPAANATPPSLPGRDQAPEAMGRALDLLAHHLGSMRISRLDHIRPLLRYSAGDHLGLDATTLRNLEVFHTAGAGPGGRGGAGGRGTLFHLVQRARTGPGARALRTWMRQPSRDPERIRRRQDAIARLLERGAQRADLREVLGSVRDVERIVARAVAGTAHPRDLAGLRDSLAALPELRTLLATALAGPEPTLEARDGETGGPTWLRAVRERLDPLGDVHALLSAALVESPPVQLSEGGVLRSDFHPEVGRLRGLRDEGARWFMDYEAKQRERTGIGSLKVRYNKVFGYYIEVTRTHLARVPEDYVRKQTIANGERYFTSELKEMEAQILHAADRLKRVERQLFEELREAIAEQAERIGRTAQALAALDALAALADLASEHGWSRPELHEGPEIEIREGRHPTLERLLPAGDFVPNDVNIGGEHGTLLLITGPNMAGKSTVMRQVALTVILAQMGAWVPAASARIGLVDRVFTRVGASDSITTGQSTFMVEMVETAEILRGATGRSLVLLDEIGRGTATFDGLSIAWAVAEHLHDHTHARTLFATHYHELCDLARTHERVRNAHVSVREWDGRILFLRRLLPGSMRRSYGVEVARLAGLPQSVIHRARAVLESIEAEHASSPSRPEGARTGASQDQLSLFVAEPADPRWAQVRELLEGVDPDSLSPRQALELVYALSALL